MSNFCINDDIKILNAGYLPDSLRYNKVQENNKVDWSMLCYNKHKTFEFHKKKFKLDGMDAVIQYMADNAISPLDELNNKKYLSHNNINE